ncbi:hypothetical protein DFR72_107407, partial [Lentzea flaviverrucosa]
MLDPSSRVAFSVRHWVWRAGRINPSP